MGVGASSPDRLAVNHGGQFFRKFAAGRGHSYVLPHQRDKVVPSFFGFWLRARGVEVCCLASICAPSMSEALCVTDTACRCILKRTGFVRTQTVLCGDTTRCQRGCFVGSASVPRGHVVNLIINERINSACGKVYLCTLL